MEIFSFSSSISSKLGVILSIFIKGVDVIFSSAINKLNEKKIKLKLNISYFQVSYFLSELFFLILIGLKLLAEPV